MTTALTLLNNVLRGLRRDILQATSTTDAYHLLLIQFLNQAKDSLEDTWDWQALRSTVTVTLSASTQTYTLSEAGPADADVSDNSRLLYERSAQYSLGGYTSETTSFVAGAQPQVFNTTDSSEYRLVEMPWEKLQMLTLTDADDTNEKPVYFALRNTGSYKQLAVWPMPTATATLKMRFVIPQAVIPNTFMTGYNLSIPAKPVWTAALVMALEERGENTGRSLGSLQNDANEAAYLAIARERDSTDDTSYPV